MNGQKILRRDVRGIKVLIATPILRLEQPYAVGLFGTAIAATRAGVLLGYLTTKGGLCEGRNFLAAQFLNSGADYTFLVDADMGWPADLLLRLLAFDKPLVAVAGRKKRDEVAFGVGFDPAAGARRDPETGLLDVPWVGAACMLIRRDCMDQMFDHYRDQLEYEQDGVATVGVFSDMIENGRLIHEDRAFCQRYRAIGGTVWVDPSVSLGHMGDKLYEGALMDVLHQIPAAAE